MHTSLLKVYITYQVGLDEETKRKIATETIFYWRKLLGGGRTADFGLWGRSRDLGADSSCLMCAAIEVTLKIES